MTNLIASVNIKDNFFAAHPRSATLANDPGSFISGLLPNLMILAGVIFFFLILVGGFGMVKSAGSGGSAQDAAKAKAAVTWGVLGFLLVVSSFFIMQLISTLTGVNLLRPVI